MPIAETFTFIDEAGRSLGDHARLDTMVTVVDAGAFLDDSAGVEEIAARGESLGPEDERTVADLLVDQVEFADVIVINKFDLASSAELARIEGLISRLNPRARTVRSTRGEVSLGMVLDTGLFDLEAAAAAPGWLATIRGEEVPGTRGPRSTGSRASSTSATGPSTPSGSGPGCRRAGPASSAPRASSAG
jgi:G3E family GTPase